MLSQRLAEAQHLWERRSLEDRWTMATAVTRLQSWSHVLIFFTWHSCAIPMWTIYFLSSDINCVWKTQEKFLMTTILVFVTALALSRNANVSRSNLLIQIHLHGIWFEAVVDYPIRLIEHSRPLHGCRKVNVRPPNWDRIVFVKSHFKVVWFSVRGMRMGQTVVTTTNDWIALEAVEFRCWNN